MDDRQLEYILLQTKPEMLPQLKNLRFITEGEFVLRLMEKFNIKMKYGRVLAVLPNKNINQVSMKDYKPIVNGTHTLVSSTIEQTLEIYQKLYPVEMLQKRFDDYMQIEKPKKKTIADKDDQAIWDETLRQQIRSVTRVSKTDEAEGCKFNPFWSKGYSRCFLTDPKSNRIHNTNAPFSQSKEFILACGIH